MAEAGEEIVAADPERQDAAAPLDEELVGASRASPPGSNVSGVSRVGISDQPRAAERGDPGADLAGA